MKVTLYTLGAIIGIVLFMMALGAIIQGGNLLTRSFFRPAEIAIDRESNRQSQQYVETEQQLMLNLVQDLRRLDAEIVEAPSNAKQAQKRATLDRLEQEAQKVPPDQVPAPVRSILQANGRYL